MLLKMTPVKEEEKFLPESLIVLFFSQYQVGDQKLVLNATKLNITKIL